MLDFQVWVLDLKTIEKPGFRPVPCIRYTVTYTIALAGAANRVFSLRFIRRVHLR
jgi:hypothetical protein